MLKNIIILLLLTGCTVLGEDKVKPGEGWKVWEAFAQNCLNDEHIKANLLITENFKEQFIGKRGFKELKKHFSKSYGKLVKEVKVKEGIIIHIQIQNENGSIFVKKINNDLKLDLLIPGFINDLKSAQKEIKGTQIKVHLAKLKSQLKQIGTAVASNYIDEGPRLIPHWKKLEIDPELMSYTHPETGKKEDILIVEGVEYNGDPDLALAATRSPIGEVHVVVWEDGHVSTVSAEKFKKLAVEMGLIKLIPGQISESEILELNKLIEKLGDKKFKERKVAKEALLKKDARIISYLEKHQNHNDFEVQVSLKEIIEELKIKSAPKRKVKK